MSGGKVHSNTWGFVLIIAGVLLLLDQLEVISVSEIISTWWPVVLILLGLRIVWRHGRTPSPHFRRWFHEQTFHTDSSDEIVRSGLFGDLNLRLTSKAFRSASIQSTAGDTALDLLELEPADADAKLAVSSVFGDVSLRVPESIPVQITARSNFGSVRLGDQSSGGLSATRTYRSPDFDNAERRLTIAISSTFGDIDVAIVSGEKQG